MPRDVNSIPPAEVWASMGDIETTAAAGITLAEGWDESFSQEGGNNPTREHFNFLFRFIFAQAKEQNRGIMRWGATVAYEHVSVVSVDSGALYISRQASTNQNPEEPNSAFWQPLSAGLYVAPPDATESRKGIAEIATQAEANADADDERILTPLKLARRTATEARTGVIAIASAAETLAGTASAKAVVPSHLASLTATQTRKGLIERATNAEAIAGTDNERAMTPAATRADVNHRNWFGTQAQFDAIASKDATIKYHIYES